MSDQPPSDEKLDSPNVLEVLDKVEELLRRMESYQHPVEDAMLQDILKTHIQGARLQIQGIRLVVEIDKQIKPTLEMLQHVGAQALQTNNWELLSSLESIYGAWAKAFGDAAQAVKIPVFYAFHIALRLHRKELNDTARILGPEANKLDA